jgi:hypothetical protein
MAQNTVTKKTDGRKKDPTLIFMLGVCILIILISGISGYLSIKESDELTEKKLSQVIATKKTKTEELKNLENTLLIISRLTGWRNEAPWTRGDVKGNWTNYVKLATSLNEWIDFLKASYGISSYEAWPKESPETEKVTNGKYLTIAKLISEFEQIIKNNESVESSVKETRDANRRKNIEVINTYPRIKEEKNNEIKTGRTSLSTQEQRVKDIIEQKETEVVNLLREIKERTRDILTIVQKAEINTTQLSKELAEYDDRLMKLKRKLRIAEEGIEVDGELIVADIGNGYVYVDLGLQDAILDGLEFEVFKIQEGTMRQYKGRIKITKIYDKYSEAAITDSVNDPQNPIAVGDVINCKTYSRTKTKSFAFVGKMIGKHRTDDLKKKIIEFGGTTPEEITPELTYLVVGDEYKDDPNFDKARQLGVVLIREKELYNLLGLQW